MLSATCRQCGRPIVFVREGHVQGVHCRCCGWQAVATYLSDEEVDEAEYGIFVSCGDVHDVCQIRAVAQVIGTNFIGARQLLQVGGLAVAGLSAAKAKHAVASLTAAGVHCEVRPALTYRTENGDTGDLRA